MPAVKYDRAGVAGKKAFHVFDSQGKLVPTRHPRMLRSLLNTKASVNLHIQMYAEGCADLTFLYPDLKELCISIKAPTWFEKAIHKQSKKLIQKNGYPAAILNWLDLKTK